MSKDDKNILAEFSEILENPDFKMQLKKAYAKFLSEAKKARKKLLHVQGTPSFLKTAVFNGDCGNLKKLLEWGEKPSPKECLPSVFFIACQLNKLEMVKLLLTYDINDLKIIKALHVNPLKSHDFNEQYLYSLPLIGGLRSNNPHILRLLVEKNPVILPFRINELVVCIHEALKYGALQSILFLFKEFLDSKNVSLLLTCAKLLYGLGIPVLDTFFSKVQKKDRLLSLQDHVFCEYIISWCSPKYIEECLLFSYQTPVASNDDKLQRLIVNGRDENFFHLIARTRKDPEVLRLFIEKFGDTHILSKSFNKSHPLPIDYAVIAGNVEIAKALIAVHPEFPQYCKTQNLPGEAAYYNQMNMFRYFYEEYPTLIDHHKILKRFFKKPKLRDNKDILELHTTNECLPLYQWKDLARGKVNMILNPRYNKINIEVLHLLEKSLHDPFNFKNDYHNNTPLELLFARSFFKRKDCPSKNIILDGKIPKFLRDFDDCISFQFWHQLKFFFLPIYLNFLFSPQYQFGNDCIKMIFSYSIAGSFLKILLSKKTDEFLEPLLRLIYPQYADEKQVPSAMAMARKNEIETAINEAANEIVGLALHLVKPGDKELLDEKFINTQKIAVAANLDKELKTHHTWPNRRARRAQAGSLYISKWKIHIFQSKSVTNSCTQTAGLGTESRI